MESPSQIGSHCHDRTSSFLVWAPNVGNVRLHIVEPADRLVPMNELDDGYFAITLDDLRPGARYFYSLNGVDRPDPASRYQPLEVHGPSELIAPLPRPRPWDTRRLDDYVIYELHAGTFTPEGTLDAAIPCLDRIRDLGVTAIELMPVAEFPGGRNWGYDGVYPFAVERSYGGPAAMVRFVEACHQRRMACILDVVYNHLGPEGNYLREFGPYFTSRYQTPWGDALNFDGPDSDHVRRYFLENALYWIEDLGIDALRLDAIHAILDRSAYPFLQELADVVHRRAAELGRHIYLIAESDLNDARLIAPPQRGGLGLDAQWSDDLHHCIHAILTRERAGYYGDFGSLQQLAAAYQRGWVYAGQYSPRRRRRFGNSPDALAARQFIVCSQNHDQIGNRMHGERLSQLVDWERTKLAAAAVLLSPFVPLLFMGEEYGEPAPFLYHVSHTDPDLQEAVRRGRKGEFAAFAAFGEPPDPQAEETFLASKINQSLAGEGQHATLQAFYRALIELRPSPDKNDLTVKYFEAARVVSLERARAIVVMHWDGEEHSLRYPFPSGSWEKRLDSSDLQWDGVGSHLPAEVDGEIELRLMPWQAAVFVPR